MTPAPVFVAITTNFDLRLRAPSMRLFLAENGAVTRDRQTDDRMISGKLRAKAGRKGAAATVISVDGTEYVWTHRHGWLVWGKDLEAISISVSLKPERTRELVLDLTLKVDREAGPPSEARVIRALEGGIRAALEAGWDPESRGRAFRLEIEVPTA
jgi:hypothetical protein